MSKNQKLKLESIDTTAENIEIIAKLFPSVITEKEDENGNIVKGIDFDLLKQQLSNDIVEGGEERYRLDRPGKKASILKANTKINKTLRPVREDSVDFDNTENLYLEGDNFEVLKVLQESYLGKVKMIYIDPPYNTGKDFVYKDDYKVSREQYEEELEIKDEQGGKLVRNTDTNGRFHSDWLSMMYERLVVARDLLKDDGVIFMSIDDNEVHNLRKISDEIFGEENFVGNLIWRKKAGGGNDSVDIATEHEYVLVYRRQENPIYKIKLKEETIMDYKYIDEKVNTHGKYKLKDLNDKSLSDSVGLHYDITCPDGTILKGEEFQWKCNLETFNRRISENRIIIKKNKKGEWKVYYKIYLNEEKGELRRDLDGNIIQKGKNSESILYNIGLNKLGNDEIKRIFNGKTFDYPKPTTLIKYLINMSTICNNNDIILDFFSGSATTAHAVMQLNAEDGGNRKFIMVQIPELTDKDSEAYKAGYENICEIGKERIRRAGRKIVEGIPLAPFDKGGSCEATGGLDIGFRVYKLDSSNMKDVYYHPTNYSQNNLTDLANNIKEDRTPEDLLTQVMLDMGLTLDLKIEIKNILGHDVFFVAGNSLVACFDKNINCEIVDEIVSYEPLKVVLRDESFVNDEDRINFETKLNKLSSDTEFRVI